MFAPGVHDMSDERAVPQPTYSTRYRDDPLGGFFFQWEFWLAYVCFVLFFVHFPWSWLTSITKLEGFVALMAHFVPSIESLADSGRHRPVPASKLQLSFLHATCLVILAYKIITQKSHPMFDGNVRWARFLCGCTLMIASTLAWTVIGFLILTHWQGTGGEDNPRVNLHGNRYQVVIAHSTLWFIIWGGLAFANAARKGLVKRLRGPSNG